ncbi:hypothetical protein FDA94_04925 [Herbidospora galbida]|uniref:DUF7674 domain-containing protein n=1 Tax=Herbidospora galbida TaxID=2575442 RepID=A0A4V6XBH4_9ACTN|nr:hypothetical protein [Herbidospora galbida]TKK90353.1 hypothetical protein FDA94_04925 [Herbidospora galbida]
MPIFDDFASYVPYIRSRIIQHSPQLEADVLALEEGDPEPLPWQYMLIVSNEMSQSLEAGDPARTRKVLGMLKDFLDSGDPFIREQVDLFVLEGLWNAFEEIHEMLPEWLSREIESTFSGD